MSARNLLLSAVPGLAFGLLLGATPASAEALSPSSLNAGYGRVMGQEARPVETSTRDANGNRVIINGLLTEPTGLSGGLGAGLGDASSPFGPLGQIDVSAVANQINIVAGGSWNTIIVEATQTNSGAVQASAALGNATVAHVSR
ncbi:holdfast anchoring protein HfaA [Phenylobacterium conjunctum]|uniref:Holdfast anchoring protein HfaA n=1 Tax=Phenylobacterium conjunctum TaxID=1298959 RepID=A0ABW3T6V4_9CAUL